MKRVLFVVALGVVVLLPSLSYGQGPRERGFAIAREIEKRDRGWRDSTARMEMVLSNRQGESSFRKIRVQSLEVTDDGDKSLTIFDSPRDVKGTVFLGHSHALEPDDQWLFLPALKRTKRISSANKSGPFMGSQFAYEDIASFEVEKYDYLYVRDDQVGGKKVHVVESFPKYEHSGYERLQVWVDRERYIPLRVDYYDRKGDLLKTLLFNKYQQYLDKYWRAGEQVMENHQNGKKTVLSWNEYRFRTGLKERDFTKSRLRRTR